MGTSQEKGDSYEEFITELLHNVKKEGRNIQDINSGRTNKILGISGCEHQIDVSFVDHSFDEPTLVLIECKNTPSKAIEKAQVATFLAIIDDIVNDPSSPERVMGIFAYANKARSGAIAFAKYYDIQMEKTGIRPNFSFNYGNLVQVGISLSSTSKFSCNGVVM